MEIEFENTENFDDEKFKSSHRIQYEAQVKVISKQIGNLEEVRGKLGLSQRKICQLLMVDPSAWTRWLKSGSAPPHIWRSLQWYLTLQEKLPGLTPNYFLGPFSSAADKNEFAGKMKLEMDVLSGRWQQIQVIQEKRIENLEKKLRLMRISLVFAGLAGAVILISSSVLGL